MTELVQISTLLIELVVVMVAGLQARVAELQALVDQGVVTDADIAAIESLKAKIEALGPTASPEAAPPAPEPSVA